MIADETDDFSWANKRFLKKLKEKAKLFVLSLHAREG